MENGQYNNEDVPEEYSRREFLELGLGGRDPAETGSKLGRIYESFAQDETAALEEPNEKLRALFYAALMFLGVYAGTVAFAGTVADGRESYENNSTSSSRDVTAEEVNKTLDGAEPSPNQMLEAEP